MIRIPISFRLTEDAVTYLGHIEELEGVTKSAIIEMSIRHYYVYKVKELEGLGRLKPGNVRVDETKKGFDPGPVKPPKKPKPKT